MDKKKRFQSPPPADPITAVRESSLAFRPVSYTHLDVYKRQVQDVSISFMTQKLTIEAEEDRLEEIMRQAVKVCKKVEPDCEIVLK